jgi:haloacetate dehalogenase
MWHKIAPRLAERFTVVAADLRGYGDSDKPASDLRHEAYSKRVMGQDMANLMDRLGFEKFSVAGHDRGARVTHRMALDHSDRLRRAVVLDIAPTRTMYQGTDMTFARAYYHWFFLIQPYDLPERLIGNDPDYFLEKKIAAWSRVEGCFTPEAVAEYKRCFRDTAGIHATCEDYRAGASIDLEHDEQDLERKVACPLLVLWGVRSIIGQTFDVLSVWDERAMDVRGRALDCGHFLPEEAPEETLEELLEFL